MEGSHLKRPVRLAPRAILMAILVSLAATAALADHPSDDAGTGQDAGGSAATATPLAYGAHHAYLAPRDHDWYRVDSAATGPLCVEAHAASANNATVRLTLESTDRNRTLQAKVPGGGATRTLALAAPSALRAWFDVTASPNDPHSGDPARPGHYEFTLAATGVPPADLGDALTGADAGDGIGSATPAPGPCFGGRIDPLMQMGDRRDTYSLGANAGDAITYGFATTANAEALTLTLLAANGTAIGPSLKTGQFAQIVLPATGTYYLSAAAVGVPSQNVGYVVSWILGPPDPGSGCRPQC